MPRRAHRASITSLALTPSGKPPVTSIRIVSGTLTQVSPVASTPAMSVAPMPNMKQP